MTVNMNGGGIDKNRLPAERTMEVARKSLSDALGLSFNILKLIMAVVLILYITSGIFVVEQHEAGIILRFGRITGTLLEPGLHWAWPFPVDEHITMPVARVHGVEVSFMPGGSEKTVRGKQKVSAKLHPGVDRYCLTGDGNIVHSKWTIRYTIADPVAYLTSCENPEKVLEAIAENSIIRGASRFGVDEALRTNVDEFRRKVQAAIVEGVAVSNIGFLIEGVDLEEILPPLQVRDAFNSVIRAEQERSKRINEARAYSNSVVSRVKGDAAKVVSKAATYKVRTIESAKADSQYLSDLLKEYPGEPEKLNVFLNQIYEEIIGEVVAGVEQRVIISKDDEGEVRYIIGPGE